MLKLIFDIYLDKETKLDLSNCETMKGKAKISYKCWDLNHLNISRMLIPKMYTEIVRLKFTNNKLLDESLQIRFKYLQSSPH